MSDNEAGQCLIFIHGVGGAVPVDEWVTPLSDVMAQLGHSRPEASDVRVITADYRAALLAPADRDLPDETWRKSRDLEVAYTDYQVRRAEVERLIAVHRAAPPSVHLGHVDDGTAVQLARMVENALHDLRCEARRYRTDAQARASVLRQVGGQMPTSGRCVILAHSLGSVVALDLVKRLPDDVVIDQLITLGSPLALNNFWPFIQTRGNGFPYDRVKSWVNVFDSIDPVAAGRGLGTDYPEALDLDVNVGAFATLVGNHAAATYLSLPVVGALVGDALFGPVLDPGAATPARRRGTAWDLYLLGAAYATQVSRTCHPKKHRWRRRFDAARRGSVLKLLAAADEQGPALVGTDAYPIPTPADLLDHAAALIKGRWDDDELLPFTVALLMSSPVRPFDIEVDEGHAQQALAALFDRIRTGESDIADQLFAQRVTEALDEAKDAMGGSAIWAYLLLGGAAVLAATGIGVWAAAPAGVAGAALLTSTLAAFGPGGMVGGMVTIAAASGAGSALLGAGLASAPADASASFVRFVDSLAALPQDQLRTTVTGMIAVLIAQEGLSLACTSEQTRSVLVTALARIVNEENEHEALESRGAKEWAVKRSIVQKAIEILDRRFPNSARRGVIEALERPRGDLKVDGDEMRALLASAQSDASA